ncbi:hypothetical protein RFI_34296, partial [Reticulomyxa filosa]
DAKIIELTNDIQQVQSASKLFNCLNIALPKCYNEFNENQIISQDLQMGQVNKEIMDVIRRNIFICVYWMDLMKYLTSLINNNNQRHF